jgi:hypothetical protein
VVLVDDDLGGPFPPPSREPFFQALAAGGWEARRVDAPAVGQGRSTVVALFGEIRAWKGRPGYSDDARATVERVCAAAPSALVVQFGHPRLIRELGAARSIVSAWGGEPVMQQAAARWLMRQH